MSFLSQHQRAGKEQLREPGPGPPQHSSKFQDRPAVGRPDPIFSTGGTRKLLFPGRPGIKAFGRKLLALLPGGITLFSFRKLDARVSFVEEDQLRSVAFRSNRIANDGRADQHQKIVSDEKLETALATGHFPGDGFYRYPVDPLLVAGRCNGRNAQGAPLSGFEDEAGGRCQEAKPRRIGCRNPLLA